MLLTEPLDEGSRALLALIHRGSGGGSGDWPVWQWVAGHAAERGLDADAVLRGLPEWQTHYRPVRERTYAGMPQPEDRLGLTVHGLAQVGDTLLLPTFLAALAEASEAAAAHQTHPQEVRPLVLRGAELLPRVRARSGFRGDELRLYELLTGEPATWSGHTEPGPGRAWSWDLTRAGLRRFAGVTTGRGYLERLEELVGLRPPARPEALPLPLLAVPEALDHLDARWLLHTSQPLLHLQRAEQVARLAQPVTSAAELTTAYTALAIILDDLEPGGQRPAKAQSLDWLRDRLTDLLEEEPEQLPPALAAVQTLRQVKQLRNNQQHTDPGAVRRAQLARQALALPPTPGQPARDWEAVRHAVVDACAALRTAIATLRQYTDT